MDKIKQLQARKTAIAKAGEAVRKSIEELVDLESFIELSSFSFSKEQFYGEDGGEGVVTGFATLCDYPFYIVAQNFLENYGGLTKANCDKIAKTLNAAEKNETPVIYLLHSQGVKTSEGIDVLEGISTLLLKATQLKGTVPQYAVIMGEVYGAAAALASVCDVTFFLKESALALTSPLVLSSKAGKNLKKEEVGGYTALSHAALPAIRASGMKEIGEKIVLITELMSEPVLEAELNSPAPALNQKAGAKELISLIEEPIELGANSYPEMKTVLGRVGGISVAAVIMDGAVLNAGNLKKLHDFVELACCYSIPFVCFVDCAGIEQTMAVNDSTVLKQVAEYLSILDATDTAKISVVTGKAVGLGYSLFAAKSAGFDYTYALATAEITLYEKDGSTEEEKDPVNAAKGGYLDNVVEPQFIKQYLIASLQMLMR